MTASETLDTIIAEAWDVFPEARLTGLGVCNCPICMDDEGQRRMAEIERGEISTEMLREWFNAAAGDDGLVPHKVATHLAPRILAMIAQGEDVFEVETPWWRKTLKWLVLAGVTIGLYMWIGHWALAFPIAGGAFGLVFHFAWCRKNGIDPWKATPRRRYWELRGWQWSE